MQKQVLGGRYALLDHLQRVGESDYYSAVATQGQRNVTIRTMDASESGAVGSGLEHLAADKLRRKIEHEAEILNQLYMPGLLQPLDYGFDTPIAYYVYPAFAFDSLALMIERRGRLPVPDAVTYIRQAAEILSALHAKNYIHCDISAETLLVVNGKINVAEFSIANHDIQDGTAPGDPPYMSPEAIQGAIPTPARDIWALGVTLYYALTGLLPFGGIEAPRPEGVPKLFQRIMNEAPSPIREYQPDIPAKLAALIDEMLAKDPTARPGSMNDVAVQLGAL